MGHARALLALPAAQQTCAAARVVDRKLSVRETERLVHQLTAPAKRARDGARARDGSGHACASRPSSRKSSARSVRSSPGARARGRVVIRYSSLDELDGILAKLR